MHSVQNISLHFWISCICFVFCCLTYYVAVHIGFCNDLRNKRLPLSYTANRKQHIYAYTNIQHTYRHEICEKTVKNYYIYLKLFYFYPHIILYFTNVNNAFIVQKLSILLLNRLLPVLALVR